MDGLFEGRFSTPTKKLYAFFRLVDAARLGQLADGDGPSRVDAALVDPFLDAVEVDRRKVKREAVLTRISKLHDASRTCNSSRGGSVLSWKSHNTQNKETYTLLNPLSP